MYHLGTYLFRWTYHNTVPYYTVPSIADPRCEVPDATVACSGIPGYHLCRKSQPKNPVARPLPVLRNHSTPSLLIFFLG